MARTARPLRMLFSCVGRRVELIEAFRASALRLKTRLNIWGTDQSPAAPAMAFVDHASIVPPLSESSYLESMTRLVSRASISLLIPLLDQDLLPMSLEAEHYAELGCRVVISDPRTVAVCRDKLLACHHLIAAGIDTPRTWTLSEARSARKLRFPYFVKPRCGSASTGLHLIENAIELGQVDHWVADPIVQEYIEGHEFTLDVYTGFDGQPHCVVPRKRLRVRGGEVVQSQVSLEPDLIAVGRRVVESLSGCRGVMTIQVIRRADGRIVVIEINPRFGGGVPLSIKAGADMPGWLMAEHLGQRPRIPTTARRDGLMMNRYDQSVFIPASATPGRKKWPAKARD